MDWDIINPEEQLEIMKNLNERREERKNLHRVGEKKTMAPIVIFYVA